MRIRFAFALATSLVGGVALAAPAPGTIGVGVAHSEGTGSSSDTTIYVPYTLNDGLWIEPFIAYARIKPKGPSKHRSGLKVGSGLFKDVHETEKTRAYVGGRLGYVYANSGAPGSSTDDGIFVQPVLGFGYEPVNNILFGAEAFVAYSNSDISGDSSFNTGTNLFVRYFFGN